MFPAIFLDRDGVLIENRSDYVRDWSQVKVLPDAIHALSTSNLRNYRIVIVTNQSAVGRGLVSLETASEINSRLIDFIQSQGGRVDNVYMCPHRPEDDCDCRKPKPGLLLQAAAELSLNLTQSWMIGDAWSDVQAGQQAGLRQTILLRTGRGKEQLLYPRPAGVAKPLVFDNLALAVDAILAQDGAKTAARPASQA